VTASAAANRSAIAVTDDHRLSLLGNYGLLATARGKAAKGADYGPRTASHRKSPAQPGDF
jgi:hypothetical protein